MNVDESERQRSLDYVSEVEMQYYHHDTAPDIFFITRENGL